MTSNFGENSAGRFSDLRAEGITRDQSAAGATVGARYAPSRSVATEGAPRPPLPPVSTHRHASEIVPGDQIHWADVIVTVQDVRVPADEKTVQFRFQSGPLFFTWIYLPDETVEVAG